MMEQMRLQGEFDFTRFQKMMYLANGTILNNTINAELNDLRVIICLRQSEVTVGGTSVCSVTEKLMACVETQHS